MLAIKAYFIIIIQIEIINERYRHFNCMEV